MIICQECAIIKEAKQLLESFGFEKFYTAV